MSAGYVYVPVSVLTSSFTEDCLTELYKKRSRMDLVSEARGAVYRDQENDHRSSGGSSVSQNKLPQLILGYIYILKYLQSNFIG